MAEPNWTVLDPPERRRTYVFPTHALALENVTRIEVRDSGKHRVETADGKKVWVNTGWLWIELEMDRWTF